MSTTPKIHRTTHTPTPWQVEPHSDTDEIVNVVSEYEVQPDGIKRANWIAELDAQIDFDSDVDEQLAVVNANAAFIVRACNAHDDLVDALKEALRYLDDGDPETEFVKSFETGRSVSITRLRAAIAKAEGK